MSDLMKTVDGALYVRADYHEEQVTLLKERTVPFVKFLFHRYSPLNTPTDQQLINALKDFRDRL